MSVTHCCTYHPSVESLEDRYTPAGTVTGSFSKGTWTLIGDPVANNITINPTGTPGEFLLIGNSTAVNGETNPQGVKNIVIKLFAGDDVVIFNNTATRAELSGNLTVIGGQDANDVFITNATLAKGVTVSNATNTSGVDDFEAVDSIIKGKVSISNGDGDTSTIFNGNSQVSSIGSLTVINGVGEDGDSLFGTSVAGSVVFKNGLPRAADNEAGYLEIYNNFGSAGRSIIGGNLSVNFKAGIINSGVTAITDVEVRGSVTFNYGSSTADIPFDGQNVVQPVLIHGNLTIIGTGPAVISTGLYDEGTGLVVDKKLTITTGGGADTLTLRSLLVNGPTLIDTGDGVDTVTIDDSRFLGPKPSASVPFAFRLLTGAGGDAVNIDTTALLAFTTQFGSTVLVSLGSGDDTLTLGALGDATRQVELFNKAKFVGRLDNDTLNQFNVVSIFDLPIQATFETVNP